MDSHLNSSEGDQEDDHHSLETSGLDDIENWIAMLNEDDAEPFISDLKKFFADDLEDNELEVNFNKPVDNVESEGKEGGEREIFAPLYTPAYGYSSNYLTGLSNPMASKRSCPWSDYVGDDTSPKPPAPLLTETSPVEIPWKRRTGKSKEVESEGKEGGEREIFAPLYTPAYGYSSNYLTGLSNPMASKRSCPWSDYVGDDTSPKPPAPLLTETSPVEIPWKRRTGKSKEVESEGKEGGEREIFAPLYTPAYGYSSNYLTGLSNPMASKRSCPWSDYVGDDTSPKPPSPLLTETSPVEIPWKRRTGKSKEINHLMEALEYYKAENDKEKQSDEEVPSPKSHPVLISHCESFAERNIINILKSVPILKLQQMLLDLDFECALQLLDIMCYLVKKKSEMELLESCSSVLIKTHLQPLLAEKTYHYIFVELKDVLFKQKVPLLNTDSSSSETSLIKEPRMRYSGWKWVENKQAKTLSDSVKVDVNSYFPVLSSSSTLGDETHVTEHHDAKKQTIACSFCSYKKTPDDGMDFIRAECGHVYCRPCSNWLFSKRNPVKPHICCKCEVIIKKFGNRPVFDE